MKNKIFKIGMSVSLLMGFTNVQASELDDKMLGHITHSIPWVEVRLPYGMTVNALAKIYYGSSQEAHVIVKANKGIRSGKSRIRKNKIIHIPVTENFTDQPERLGWVR